MERTTSSQHNSKRIRYMHIHGLRRDPALRGPVLPALTGRPTTSTAAILQGHQISSRQPIRDVLYVSSSHISSFCGSDKVKPNAYKATAAGGNTPAQLLRREDHSTHHSSLRWVHRRWWLVRNPLHLGNLKWSPTPLPQGPLPSRHMPALHRPPSPLPLLRWQRQHPQLLGGHEAPGRLCSA